MFPTSSLPLRPKLLDKKRASFLERLGVCFSLLSVQGPDSGVCQELSLRLLQACGAQEPRPPPRPPELGPQGAATKTGSPDVKQKQSTRCVQKPPLGGVGGLGCGRRRA